ncbi:MAG TPA: hypothetical protein VLR49_01105 [Ferruginibacter sp.]|nr:hypothetical protein [Ferruginibacter sp.]
MQDIELNNIWKQYDQKLEEARLLNLQSWALNLQNFEMQQKQKVKSKLNKLVWQKLFLVIVGIIYAFTLYGLIFYSMHWSKIFFVISASAIAIVTTIAIAVYIKQVFIIRKINHTDSVVDAQKKISMLQSGTLQITRILFLQAPFYCTWFLTPAMIAANPGKFLFISLPVFLLFTWVSVFLYRNINYKNMQKKWFKILFSSPEWVSLIKSAAFLNEIDEFKKEIVIK